MDRRNFIKRGSLWTVGAAVITPELLDRLTWTRRLWPGTDFMYSGVWARKGLRGFDSLPNTIELYSMPLHYVEEIARSGYVQISGANIGKGERWQGVVYNYPHPIIANDPASYHISVGQTRDQVGQLHLGDIPTVPIQVRPAYSERVHVPRTLGSFGVRDIYARGTRGVV